MVFATRTDGDFVWISLNEPQTCLAESDEPGLGLGVKCSRSPSSQVRPRTESAARKTGRSSLTLQTASVLHVSSGHVFEEGEPTQRRPSDGNTVSNGDSARYDL